MGISTAKNTCLLISLSLLLSSCGTKTETKVVTIPEVKTVEVPVFIPGEKEFIKVPEIVFVDKSVGIKSLPKPISTGAENIQSLGKSVAKVFSATGASGTGFFISKDGLFLTNEHVIPISACRERRCPGYKIVTGFHKDGATKAYTNFEVLAQDDGQYDFALIKVNLPPNEIVEYLDLDFAKKTADQISAEAIVLGHPGGASLHFAEAKPIETPDVSIRFQGIVIPGNSGGPLVDLKTSKVIGLVKSMRTMPSKDGAGSAFFENFNQATAIWELNDLIQQRSGSSIISVSEATNMKELDRASEKITAPDVDDFGSILRRPSEDARVHASFSKFMRLMGSEHEHSALSLMLAKSEKFSGTINMQTLSRLLNFSLAAGRPLRFESSQIQEIENELNLIPEAMSVRTAKILLNFFDKKKLGDLQKNCLKSVGDTPQLLMMAPYSCYATQLSDGRSIFPIYADWLINKSGYKTLDQFASSTALMMMTGPIGLQDSDDLKSLEDINNFISEKSRDLETVMRNDGYAIGLLKSQLGIGSFKETFRN